MLKHSFLLYKKLYPLLGVNFDNLSLRQYCERYIIEEFNTASIIRDVTKWNIAHVFINLSSLLNKQIPFPVLIRLKDKTSYHLIFKRTSTGFLVYDPDKQLEHELDYKEIISSYDPLCLIFETTISTQKTTKWYLDFQKNGKLISIVSMSLFSFLFLGSLPTINTMIIFALSMIGLLICWQIKKIGLQSSSDAIKQFCEDENLNFSCKEVLQSKYSKLFNFIPINDFGLVYFNTLLIFILLNEVLFSSLAFSVSFYAFNVIALLATTILFVIQRFIIRTYCPLCLSIFAISGVINIFSFYFIKRGAHPQGLNLIIISFLFSIIITVYISRTYLFERKNRLNRLAFLKLSEDNDLFKKAIHDAGKQKVELIGNSFVINYKEDSERIDVVLSNSCKFCKTMFKELLNLLLLSDEYSVYIKFDSINRDNVLTKIQWLIDELIAIHGSFNDYFDFSIRNSKEVLFKGNLNSKISDKIDKNVLVDSFKNKYDCSKFPTILLNGREVPPKYEPEKLKLHLVLNQYK